MDGMVSTDRYYTLTEAARYLQVSASYVAHLRRHEKIMRDSNGMYAERDLEAFKKIRSEAMRGIHSWRSVGASPEQVSGFLGKILAAAPRQCNDRMHFLERALKLRREGHSRQETLELLGVV